MTVRKKINKMKIVDEEFKVPSWLFDKQKCKFDARMFYMYTHILYACKDTGEITLNSRELKVFSNSTENSSIRNFLDHFQSKGLLLYSVRKSSGEGEDRKIEPMKTKMIWRISIPK